MKRPDPVLGLFLVLAVAFSAHADVASKNNSANGLFKLKKYGPALQRYAAALAKDPNAVEPRYNAANVFYRQGEPEKAVEQYEQCLSSKDRTALFRARYNEGNAYFRQQKFKEAGDAFVEALKLFPADEDAKFNLELARLAQKAQKEQPRQKQQEKQDKKQDKQKKGKDKDDQDQKQNKPGSEKQMSKEEAEQVLNSVLDQERKNQEQENKKRMEGLGRKYIEKDW